MPLHKLNSTTALYMFGAALAAALVAAPVSQTGFHVQLAQAVAQEPIDFREALEGYGHWVRHPRWGEVWVPEERTQDWQPYRAGHWVFTDEWGWYWNSDEDFGWVTYHYGRWLMDRDFGWIWLPDDEWAPAWVNWRQGDDFVGWAPQPPEAFIDEDEDPDSYLFVRAGDLLVPEVYTVIIPIRERGGYFGRSRIVNRTFVASGRRFGINPGIPPAFIARSRGRSFHAVSVAPVVLGGTAGVAGAIILRNGYHDRNRTRIKVRETQRTVQPDEPFRQMKALQKGERGRLGDTKLKAVQGGSVQPRQAGERRDMEKRGEKRGDRPDNRSDKPAAPDGQNATGQKTMQPSGAARDQRGGAGDRKRPEDNNRRPDRQNNQRNNTQRNNPPQNDRRDNLRQKNLQQKNPQQNNRPDGSGNADQRRNMQRDDGRRNIQPRNTQPRTEQQRPAMQQHNAPQRGMQQRDSQPRVQQQQPSRNSPPQRGKQQDQQR